jgi:hypothetical protein
MPRGKSGKGEIMEDRCPSCGEIVPEGVPCGKCYLRPDINEELKSIRESHERELKRRMLLDVRAEGEEINEE